LVAATLPQSLLQSCWEGNYSKRCESLSSLWGQCLFLWGILGDSSALQAQQLLDYVLYTLKVAFWGPFTTTGIRGSPVN
jgi:hypothetical protein